MQGDDDKVCTCVHACVREWLYACTYMCKKCGGVMGLCVHSGVCMMVDKGTHYQA